METRVPVVFCALFFFFFCSLGAVFSAQTHRYHTQLWSSSAHRNLSTNHRSRYPLYMMKLYRSFRTSDFVSSPAVSAAAAPSERPAVQSSDSVLSLMAKRCHQVGDRWAVTFDMSSISTRELVLLAELQIKLPAFSTSKRAAVDLYHSRKQSCDLDRASCQEEEEEVFLGSLGATPSSTKASWKVFNVTELLKYWLYKRSDVLGQEASGEPDTGDGSGSGDPVNTDDKFSSNNLMAEQRKVNHPTTNRVMMVVFSKQQQLQEGHAAYSLIHTVENSKYVTPNSVRGDGQSRRHKRNRIKGMRAPDGAEPTEAPAAERVQRPLCRRVDMWVDFDHIGWDEWIVHPKRYNAYRCEGACPSPLDESFSPTNHAYMQSLLRLHHPDRVSCPSCVPTRLSPLSMLYYESDDLTLRHHEEMIVEECGCH
ncbi:southpaw isoform X2 [Kryptolebias marmoratus]|uniref:Southpaw n=1 Tax=Kryptolebias marmoratus TaxID=37003 RepID=A0A3Q3BH92_KRYMA|nr:southpaw isoform X2 [Kryptolebias marmoratus]